MNPLSIKKIAVWIVCAWRRSRSGARRRLAEARRSERHRQRHGHRRVGSRLAALRAHRDHVGLDRSGRRLLGPVTGAYAADLADATTYTFAVTAVGPGYAAGGGTVVTAGAPLVADWTLGRRGRLRRAGLRPDGPSGRRSSSESFDGGVIPPGWTVETNSGGSPGRSTREADPCGLLRREPDRRVRPLRDRQQQLRVFVRRHVPGHAGDRPVAQRERRHPLGQRLHRDRLRRHRRGGRLDRRRRDLDERLAGLRRWGFRARAR